MPKNNKTIREPIVTNGIALFVVLSILVGFSLYWNITNLQQEKIQLATDEARANLNKDQAFRGWATKHGGLYVKPNKRTPPNPYLAHLPHRDVVTTDGVKLTLMNPAYMMTQMTKEYEDTYGIKGSITGKILLNPDNVPDEWQLRVLEEFDKGKKEVIEQTMIDSEPYIRYMKPMLMKQGCVKCHGHLGFKKGDIRGGVSVSIPLKPYIDATEKTVKSMRITHATVWGLGVLGLIGYALTALRRENARDRLQDQINNQNIVLAAAEERSRQILDSAGEGIFGLDVKGNVIFINPAALEMLGYSSDEVIGESIHTLVQHSYADGSAYNQADSPIQNVLTDGESRHINNEIMWRKNGSYIPVEYNATPIIKNSQPTGCVVVFADITERLRIDKMKNEFISTVSHELRTPLTSIRGSLGLAVGGAIGDIPEQAQEILEVASNNSERLLLLINDILDIQKIEADELVFNFENMALLPFLEKALIENATYGEQYKVKFVLDDDLYDGHVSADPGRLMQVMANLLSNAAKFSHEGGTVEVGLTKYNDAVRISVTDHGSGIPEEFRSKIFNKFTQADSSDVRQKGGTGLGLNITKAIVEKHGGKISFVSNKGNDTTFYIELPEVR